MKHRESGSLESGVELVVELVEQGGAVSALALPADDTATGHRIAATLWPIDGATTDNDTTTIKLGQRLGP